MALLWESKNILLNLLKQLFLMVAFPFRYVDLFRNGGNLRMRYPLMCFNGAIVLQIVQNHSFLRKKRK